MFKILVFSLHILLVTSQECKLTCEEPNLPTTSLIMGKTGPRGEAGPQGTKGEIGDCVCDLSEVEDKITALQSMVGKIEIKSLYIESAGLEDGLACVIKLNGGENICQNHRGHNVVVINPLTGNIISKAFDTHGSSDQVTDLINFLKDDVAFGSIIIIAVRDSTNENRFFANSVAYLEKLGAGIEGCPVKIGIRDSWAMLTLKRRDGKIPDWFDCKHVAKLRGKAIIEHFRAN